jgi:hypothetical protein
LPKPVILKLLSRLFAGGIIGILLAESKDLSSKSAGYDWVLSMVKHLFGFEEEEDCEEEDCDCEDCEDEE